MNILFVDQFSEMGGAQQSLLTLIEGVQQQGWASYACIPGDGPLTSRLQALGVAVTPIPCGPYRSGAKSGMDMLRFVIDIQRQSALIGDLLRRASIDLIYVNGPRVMPGVALAAGSRVPAIFHAHSVPPRSSAPLVRWGIRRMGAIVIACSKFVAEYVDVESVQVIPNGVADLGFRQRAFGEETKWRVGVVGRISPQKGQADFLNAAAILAPRYPAMSFVICGSPIFGEPEHYMHHIRALAANLPVEFIGWGDDMPPVFAELDLLVVPSKDEGLGRVILEAFSAGVPVIAYSSGGIPEVIVDGVTGFLTADMTPASLANRISDAVQCDSRLLRRVAANARGAWEKRYTVRAYRDDIMTTMADLTGASKAMPEIAALRSRR